MLLRRKAALRVHVTQLGAGTKFGGARRRARAVSGVSGKVLATYRPAIAAFVQGGPTRKKFHAQETSQRSARSAGAFF